MTHKTRENRTEDPLTTRLRAETPGCEKVLHFNNAGAGLMPRQVLDAVKTHLDLEASTGGYEAFAAVQPAYLDTYHAIAELIRAHPGEIALAENATRAWDMVFYGIRWKPGDRVLTAQASYASNYLAMMQVRDRFGIDIDVAPNDADGQVDVHALEGLISARTRLICLTHVPTNSGLVNPAEDVGEVARKHGLPYLLDACQSAGQVDLDVNHIGCDFLSATGRKYLRGPRGTGFLFVRSDAMDLLDPPFLDLHAARWSALNAYELMPDARRFESWEGYVAGKIGLGVAVRYALEIGMPTLEARIRDLAAGLRQQLAGLPGITVHDEGVRQCGIVTFSHARTPSSDIRTHLAALKMNVNLSDPDWARLDAERRGLPIMIRASIHAYNTLDEVDRFTDAVRLATT
ncbi:MAG: aminotransferase class V-fold PLP-dependent enzyme [Rhodothermales bacterium]